MKKYKMYVIYHFVGGTTITLTDDIERRDITEGVVEEFIKVLLKTPNIHQVRGQTGVGINMANVTTVEVEFKEVVDEEKNETNS